MLPSPVVNSIWVTYKRKSFGYARVNRRLTIFLAVAVGNWLSGVTDRFCSFCGDSGSSGKEHGREVGTNEIGTISVGKE